MKHTPSNLRAVLLGTVAVSSLAAVAPASAGGFAIREQSTVSQGASFAGNAAGSDLGTMFWNAAGAGLKPGLNSESHFALIIPDAEITVNSASPVIGGFGNSSGDIAGMAIVPASYVSYQFKNFDPNLFLGIAINSPFGLTTEPDNRDYQGSVLARTSKLFTTNINPNLAYRIAPGVTVGIGAQFQYADGTFKFATGLPDGQSTYFRGDDIAVGGTAGILLQPTASTTIGLGYRSQLTHKLEGDFGTVGTPLRIDGEVELNLPDIVTLSFRQAITPQARVMGTVEWSHWSRFQELRVEAANNGLTIFDINPRTGLPASTTTTGQTIATIDANWADGWFFSLGGEYDLNARTTLRAGVAYEISPVDDPTKRIIGIPDSDRIWLSLGGSYKWSEFTTLDFAYTHIFLDDATFDRTSLSGFALQGDVEASTDIVSVSLRTKWQ